MNRTIVLVGNIEGSEVLKLEMKAELRLAT